MCRLIPVTLGLVAVLASCSSVGSTQEADPTENAIPNFFAWLDIIAAHAAVTELLSLGVAADEGSGSLETCNHDPIDGRPPLLRFRLLGDFRATVPDGIDLVKLFESHGWVLTREPTRGPAGSAALTKDFGEFTALAGLVVFDDEAALDIEICQPDVCADGSSAAQLTPQEPASR